VVFDYLPGTPSVEPRFCSLCPAAFWLWLDRVWSGWLWPDCGD